MSLVAEAFVTQLAGEGRGRAGLRGRAGRRAPSRGVRAAAAPGSRGLGPGVTPRDGAAGTGLRRAGGGRTERGRTEPGPEHGARSLRTAPLRAEPCVAAGSLLYGLPNPGCAGALRYFHLIASLKRIHFLQWVSKPCFYLWQLALSRAAWESSVWRRARPVPRGARCAPVFSVPRCSLCPGVPGVPCAGRLRRGTGPLLPVGAPGSRCSCAVCAGRDLELKQKEVCVTVELFSKKL